MSLKNLVKLYGGAAAGKKEEIVDCNDARIFTLKNNGGRSAFGSPRHNQCMWISIHDFLKAYDPRCTFEDVVRIAEIGDFRFSEFNIESVKFNAGRPPAWACPNCTIQDRPPISVLDRLVVSCSVCDWPAMISYPLQRLANHYNIRIQIYKVVQFDGEVYDEKGNIVTSKLITIDESNKTQKIPVFGFCNIQPIAQAQPAKVVHIAQYPGHFELIVCGYGITVPIAWQELNKAHAQAMSGNVLGLLQAQAKPSGVDEKEIKELKRKMEELLLMFQSKKPNPKLLKQPICRAGMPLDSCQRFGLVSGFEQSPSGPILRTEQVKVPISRQDWDLSAAIKESQASHEREELERIQLEAVKAASLASASSVASVAPRPPLGAAPRPPLGAASSHESLTIAQISLLIDDAVKVNEELLKRLGIRKP